MRNQIRYAVDPTGKRFELIEAVEASPELPTWLSTLNEGLSEQWAQLGGLSAEYRIQLRSLEDALRLLVPRGWAPLHMDAASVNQAVKLVRDGRGDEADELLADQWEGEGSWRTQQVYSRVSVLGAGEGQPEYHGLFKDRSRLILKAKEHHETGRYEASIPLLQNQMEGIVADVAKGRNFSLSVRIRRPT